MANPCIYTYKGKDYTFHEFATLLHDGELSNLADNGIIIGDFVKSIPNELKIVKNESTSPSNIDVNEGVRLGTEPMEQVGIEEKPQTEIASSQNIQSANDVRPTEGETKITQEPTLEDIETFLNENFKANETNTTTETQSVQKNSAMGKGEKLQKNPSQRGKTPLDKRKIKDKDVISALKSEVFDAYSLAQQYFIGGGRVLPSEIKRLFNSDSEVKSRIGYARTLEKKGATIDKIAHNLWEEFGRDLNLDTSDFKDAVEQVISDFVSTKSMAVDLNKRNGLNFEENAIDENEFYAEAKAMELVNENDHKEALSYLDVLTDEELVQLADEQVSFEDFLATEQNKQSEYKFSNSPSLKNAQAVDSSVLPITSKSTENIIKNEGNWNKAIIGDVKNIGNGWFEVGKSIKGESILYSPKTDKAVTIVDSENKGGRNAVYVNDFVNNNPTISEKQQRKDKANAEVDADLFSKEYYDKLQKDFPNTLLAIEEKNGLITIFENGETREIEDYEFVKELKNALAKGYKGIIKVTRKVVDTETKKLRANAEVDKIADKIKDLLPGIKDGDVNIQGFSQDQLIDLVAKAVKNLISTGIEIDEAIRQVSTSIKERFNIEVNADDVKAKLEPKKEPNRTFERKQGELSVLNRLKKGGNSDKITDAIEKIGTKYDVRNQDQLARSVSQFVDEVGILEAYNSIVEGKIKNDDTIILIYDEIVQRMPEEIEKTLNSISDQNERYQEEQALYDEYAKIQKEYAEKAMSMGQGISILNYIYNRNSEVKYDLSRQVQQYKTNNNGEIPDNVLEAFKEADAKLKIINEKIKEAEERLKKAEEEQVIKNIQEDIEKSKKPRVTKKPHLSEEEQKRKNQLRRKFFGTLNDVTRFAVILADPEFREYLRLTIKEARGEFREFAEEVLKTLGKGARKYLPELYKEAGGKGEVDTKFLNTIKISKDGKISIPEQMIRDYVEEGYTEIDDLANALLNTIKDEYPDVDVRDIRDAITKYGKTINPSKDEVSAQIRKMRRIGKLISGLEDAYSGKRPKRSGLQRDELTQQEREMKRELRDLLRDLPMDDTDTAKKWKTALDAVKSRLKNSIEDLEKQIANKEKSKPERNPIEYDEEAKSLKRRRDELRIILEDLVGKPELTEEQKIERTEKYLVKSIDALREQIDSNNIAFKSKGNPVTSARIENLKQEQSELRKQLAELRRESGLVEAKRLETAKKSVKNRIADLERRIKEGDYSKKEIKPLIPDTELAQLQAEKIRIQEVFDSEKYKQELKNRTKFQKGLDALLEVWNIPRILKATGEVSTVFVQGGILTVSRKLTNPILFLKEMKRLFTAIGSDKKAREFESLIKAHPLYPIAEKSKLALTNPDYKTSVKEEMYTGDYMNLIWDLPIFLTERAFNRTDLTNKEVTPIGNKLINKVKEIFGKEVKETEKVKTKEQWKNLNPFVALERGGTMYMNKLRFEEFVRGCEMLELEGKNPIDNIEDYKLMANAINTMTGRANIGTLATNSKVLAGLFFSFRNWVSVTNQMNPIYYGYLHFADSKIDGSNWYKQTSVANKLATMNMLRFITITGTTIMLMKALAGKDDEDKDVIEVETDPRSSDFMKMKIGNIRFDPWHGQSTQVVFMARMLTDEKKSTSTGEIKKLGEGYGGVKSRGDLSIQYVSNKFAPSMAMMWKYMNTHEGYDKLTGEKVRLTPYGEVYDTSDESLNLAPMYWASLQEIKAEDPNAWAQFLTVASFFGINSTVYKDTNTFENKQARLAKEYIAEKNKSLETITQENAEKAIKEAEGQVERLKEFINVQKKNPSTPYYVSKDVRWTSKDLSVEEARKMVIEANEKIQEAKIKYNVK